MKQTVLFILTIFISIYSYSQAKRNISDSTKKAGVNKVINRQMSPMNFPVVYTFTGNGNWSDATNWDSNGVPPAVTAPNSKIIINTQVPGGKCILDVPYVVQNGTISTQLIVTTGNNLVIPGNLTVK